MATSIRPARLIDASAIAAIYNQGIAERSSTFETTLRSAEDMQERIEAAARFPVLVAVDSNDVVLGWAGLSAYRTRACYSGVAEFSIYIDSRARGRGTGKLLLNALIEEASTRGYWKLLSRIFPFNAASRALCRACGFREVGTYEKHARLDGSWLDVVIVERLIPAGPGSLMQELPDGQP
jgi:L-amino acid N-acyltransferase YncA